MRPWEHLILEHCIVLSVEGNMHTFYASVLSLEQWVNQKYEIRHSSNCTFFTICTIFFAY